MIDTITLAVLAAGLILGALLTAIVLRSRQSAAQAVLQNQNQELETRQRELRAELANREDLLRALQLDLETERQRRAVLEGENKAIPSLEAELDLRNDQIQTLNQRVQQEVALRSTAEEKTRRLPILEQTVQQADDRLREARDQITQLREQNMELQTTLEKDREAAREKIELLQKTEAKLTMTFDALSKQALQSNNQSFLDLARESFQKYQEAAKGDLEKRQQAIGELLTPLSIKIRDFEQKVDEVYRIEAAERNTLKGEIRKLHELNQQISKEANNLVLALKGDTKKQGNWGELICEKILEYSGLRKGEEYKIQVSLEDSDGRKLQPDIVVYLPDGKHIIIDSKVSLVAYDRFVSADTEEGRSAAKLEHIASVKRHIRDLSEKKYPSLPALDAPDFTLLFMPIESSFGVALQADNELFVYAWDRKIVIVSPSTLLATLRTISSLWKQERQTKNAIEIAERAGKMYDKFVGFVDDLVTVGNKIGDVKSRYEEAMKKLSTGTGNLVRQSEQLREMGAKATKQLPVALIDRSIELPETEVAAGAAEVPALTNDPSMAAGTASEVIASSLFD